MAGKKSLRGGLALVAAVLVAIAGWWLQQGGTEEVPRADDPAACVAPAGLDCIAEADLPAEAVQTLELIDAGGPFPYDRDGITFHNFEGLLPEESDGYYREYTVETPGIEHRGARRIVTGAEGEYYWTTDHYESFEVIVR